MSEVQVDPGVFAVLPRKGPRVEARAAQVQRQTVGQGAPPAAVQAAVSAGVSRVTRRVEIYESDGVTPWYPCGDLDYKPRLMDGSVNIEYGRDERRTVDLTLFNADQCLRPDPDGGFWYDKVLKVFRGIRYPVERSPRAALIGPAALTLSQAKTAAGIIGTRTMLDHIDIHLNLDGHNFPEHNDLLKSYDIVIIVSSGLFPPSFDFQMLIDQGVKFFFWNTGTALVAEPWSTWFTYGSVSGTTPGIQQPSFDTPARDKWTNETYASGQTINTVTALNRGRIIATRTSVSTYYPAVIVDSTNGSNGAFFMTSTGPATNTGTQFWLMVDAVLDNLLKYIPYQEWEAQIGEFVIDTINDENFPSPIKVTGRDYSKTMLGAKVATSGTFTAGMLVSSCITMLAEYAGIDKIRLPSSMGTIEQNFTYAAGQSTWEIATQLAKVRAFDLYFDTEGNLTASRTVDTESTPAVTVFQTGDEGNLVKFSRSLSDSEIYNHIVARSDASEEGKLPVWASAENNQPGSPTRIAKLNRRTYEYVSSAFTSVQMAQDFCNNLIKVLALESYNINFESVVYPWLEVGQVIELLDPNRLETDPTRFLLVSLSIPLTLSPMSGSGKRITVAGDDAAANLVGVSSV